jgi:ankyrin repeat protein
MVAMKTVPRRQGKGTGPYIMEHSRWMIDFFDRDNDDEIANWVVVNQRDCYGNTALHLAAWNGAKKAFKYLVEHGADTVRSFGLRQVFLESRVVSLLVPDSVCVFACQNLINNDGLTPFSLTARHGLWDMFAYIYQVLLLFLDIYIKSTLFLTCMRRAGFL